MMIYSAASTTATNTTTPSFWFTAYKREVGRAAVTQAFDELVTALRNLEDYLHELAQRPAWHDDASPVEIPWP